MAIVAGERQDLEAAANVLETAGRPGEAAGRRARAAVLNRYLAA